MSDLTIDFAFACRDDCLDKMVPSDLRILVDERDRLAAEVAELRERVTELAAFKQATIDALPVIQAKPEAAAAYLREHLPA